MHEIHVGVNPTHMNNYNVNIIGSVCDSNGLITIKMEERLLKVRSRCMIDLEMRSVSFEIVFVESCSPLNPRISNNFNNVIIFYQLLKY